MSELPEGFRLSARTIDVGEFVVGDVLVVADPCYVNLSSIRLEVCDVLAGTWRAQVDVSDPLPGWGERESCLRAASSEVADLSGLGWEHLGKVCVDSGRVSVGNLRADWRERYAFSEEPRIIDGAAVVCCSGFGDGVYNARIGRRVGDDKVVAVWVVFITMQEAAEQAKESQNEG